MPDTLCNSSCINGLFLLSAHYPIYTKIITRSKMSQPTFMTIISHYPDSNFFKNPFFFFSKHSFLIASAHLNCLEFKQFLYSIIAVLKISSLGKSNWFLILIAVLYFFWLIFSLKTLRAVSFTKFLSNEYSFEID